MKRLKYIGLSAGALITAFLLSLCIQTWLKTETLIPAVFALAVMLISMFTEGYVYGILSSLMSVLAVNYAFTFPYFKVNFTIPENFVSALIMIVITLLTGTLTTKKRNWEAVRAESEKEKMRANLLRAISHDLRTPLTAIYGSASAILENGESLSHEKRTQLVQGIREDSSWLIRMVENLLSVTRIGEGNVRIIKSPTVLEELIDSVLVKFRKQYPGRIVSLQLPEEVVIIPMDAILIEQVITNILDNAMRHAEGMKSLGLRVYTEQGKAIFEIADDGCGIPEERLKELFSGMLYGSKTYDRKKGNAGIGLCVCATIVRAHGGEITAENGKNGGAVFRFCLDIEEDEDEQ